MQDNLIVKTTQNILDRLKFLNSLQVGGAIKL